LRQIEQIIFRQFVNTKYNQFHLTNSTKLNLIESLSKNSNLNYFFSQNISKTQREITRIIAESS